MGLFLKLSTEHADFSSMPFVLNVKPEWRAQLFAITHVDGSARLQTVSRTSNPSYWELWSDRLLVLRPDSKR